jgi:cytochrome o ubiquinol oxidase operon protein cyoD
MLDREHGWNISLKPPVLGYVLSLIILAGMYRLVARHHLSGSALVWTVFGLGVTQALLQLIFFLHLGLESKPHWNSITFLFALLVVVIVIGGSMWIMQNLNYNVMPPMKEVFHG